MSYRAVPVVAVVACLFFCDMSRSLDGGLNHVLTISNRILREKCADRY